MAEWSYSSLDEKYKKNFRWFEITAQKNDTIQAIDSKAKHLNPLSLSIEDIKKVNNINSDKVPEGTKVKVFGVYEAQKSSFYGEDTINQVLMAFSIEYKELEIANPYIDSKIISSVWNDIMDNLMPFGDDRKLVEGALINLPYSRVPLDKFTSTLTDKYIGEEFNPFIADEGSRTYQGPPPFNNLNVTPLDYYNDIFPEHRKINNKYKLRIGDCMFFIPPEFIQVNKQASANEFPLLRQKGTMKTHNGFAMTRIEITLWFTDLEQINGFKVQSPNGKDNPYYMDGLRPLIAQFKRTPFLPVENELLNNMFDIYAVSFVNLAFSTIQQLPGTLQASLILYKMETMPILERPSWMYDKMILYPLFRSYYQQSLLKEKSYSNSYLEEVTSKTFTDSFHFSMLDESALKNLNNPNTKITVKVLDEGIKSYNPVILPDDLYCTSITSSIGSITTPIAMTGYDTPAFQYMGSADTSFVIKFETMNQAAVSDLYSMYEKCLYYSREYRNRVVSGYVKVKNSIVNMCGVRYLMIIDMTVSTVPEYPGLYTISMTATSHEANQHSSERLKGFNGVNESQATKILEYNLDIINHITKDVQQRDMSHIVEEINAEAIIDTLELYPDLALPKYSMVHDEIIKINKFRKNAGLKEMPIDRYVPASIRYKYWDETVERYKLNSMEHYVDPDFYMVYPDIEKFKEYTDEGSLYDYEQAIAAEELARGISEQNKSKFSNIFSEEVDSISESPITGLSFTERVVETNVGVLLSANQYDNHPNAVVKSRLQNLKNASKYNQYFINMGKRYGIDEKMLLVCAVFESSGGQSLVGPNLGGTNKITGFPRISSIDCGLMQINVTLSEDGVDEKKFFEAFKKSSTGTIFLSKGKKQSETEFKQAIKNFITEDCIKNKYKEGLNWLKGKIHAAKDSSRKNTTMSASIYDLITNPEVCVQFAANLLVSKRTSVREHFKGFVGYNDNFEIRAMFIYYMRIPKANQTSKQFPKFRDIWSKENHVDKGMGQRVAWGEQRFALWWGLNVVVKNENTGKKEGVKQYYIPKASVSKMTIENESSYGIDILVPIPEDQTKDKFSGNYDAITKKFIKNTMRNEAKKYSKKGRLIRAFPTYCLVFVDEGITIDYRRIWNNYYAYHAVQDISVVKERENPIDTAYIRLSNVYGALDFIDKELVSASKKLYKIGTSIDNISKFVSRNFNANNTTAQQAQASQEVSILSEDGEVKKELLSEFYEVVVGEKPKKEDSSSVGELLSQYWNAWFPQITKDVAKFRLQQVTAFGIMLKTGARVHLRLGYGAIGSKMPIVFNGTITEMTEGDILDIVCQSDGMELLNRAYADKPDDVVNWYSFDQEPREVMEHIMTETGEGGIDSFLASVQLQSDSLKSLQANLYQDSKYGIKHFGHYTTPGLWQGIKDIWQRRDVSIGQNIYTRDSLLNTFDITKNIYAATNDAVINTVKAADDERNFYFYINEKKPWDIFKFFESSIPEFETKIFEHGFHSTLFFGKPHWYARTKYYTTTDRRDTKFFEAIRIAQQIHDYNSVTDIISNNISTTHTHFSTIVIPTYKLGAFDSVEAINPIYLDRNIKTEYQRTEFIDTSHLQDYPGPDALWDVLGNAFGGVSDSLKDFQNWTSKMMGGTEKYNETREGPSARKFATYSAITHMRHSLRDMYEGELNVIGDAAVRPGDILLMDDSYTLLKGPAEVGRVIHHFSLETGFVTSIKPDLISILAKPENGELDASGYVNYNIRKSIMVLVGEIGIDIGLVLIRKLAAKKLMKNLKEGEYEETYVSKDGKPIYELNGDGTPKLDSKGNPIVKTKKVTRQRPWMRWNITKDLAMLKNSIKTGRYAALIGSAPSLATGLPGVALIAGELIFFAAIDHYMTKLIEAFIHRDAGIKIFPLFQRGMPYVSGISGHKNIIPGYIDETTYASSKEDDDPQTKNEKEKTSPKDSAIYDNKPLGNAVVKFPATIKYCFPIESNNGALNIKTNYYGSVSKDFRFGVFSSGDGVIASSGARYYSPGVELNFSKKNNDPQNVFSIGNGKVIHIFDKTTTSTSGIKLLNFNKRMNYNDYGVIIEIYNEKKLKLDDAFWGYEKIPMQNHLSGTDKYPRIEIYGKDQMPDKDETEKIYVIYFGFSKVSVYQNEEVKVGQVIGEFAKGSKLYMETQDKNNLPFDPIYFLKEVGARVVPFNPQYNLSKKV